MFRVMKILLKQNTEAKGSAKETKPISKFFVHETPDSASVRHSEIPVSRTTLFFLLILQKTEFPPQNIV